MLIQSVRSRSALLGAFILMMVLLAACGNSNSNSNSNGAPPSANSAAAETPSATPAASEEPATYTYKDALGREVVIPTHPQRIIATQYLPEMIAVGVKPVGAASHLLTNFVAIKDQIDGIEDIGAANNPSLEKILTLKPDLIIVAEWNKDQLENLSKIAPTIVIQWADHDAFEHFKETAAVLGLSDKADAWITAYNQKAEDARAKLASTVKPGETFGVVAIGGYEMNQLRVYGDSNVGFTLFNSLQFPMTDTVKTEWAKGNNENGLTISLEKLSDFASADRLFLVTFDNDPDFAKQVNESSLWKNLPAVKNGKVYTVNPDLWFSYDVMSFHAQLDDAVQILSQ
ncbi:ABC transporter substrate-binding protein [Paenibacillus glycanilyticus]|uniref:ABC transporter substrate-binding protein n=1 Tax=Paenibacillus glycanilyticus TaxID=126569 RepID=UPI0013E3D22C|nr:ABC transporter substrate-binding protein [Paenibacillus glycanilyticus]